MPSLTPSSHHMLRYCHLHSQSRRCPRWTCFRVESPLPKTTLLGCGDGLERSLKFESKFGGRRSLSQPLSSSTEIAQSGIGFRAYRSTTLEGFGRISCMYAIVLSSSSSAVYFFTLNMLNRAKQPYNKPTGYATSNLWWSILSTTTKMLLAECVHQTILKAERR